MPNSYTEITTKSYGGRLINSIKGILIGLLLFVGAFVLLYWNEGRTDLSRIADTAMVADAQDATTGTALDGQLVSVSGLLTSDEMLGDGAYLKAGPYIAFQRQAEAYAWVEHSSSKSTKDLGGSETTETTYTYTAEWTGNPSDSSEFKHPEGHQNPTFAIKDTQGTVSAAKVGAYGISPGGVAIHGYKQLILTSENTSLQNGGVLADDRHIFIGRGSPSSPNVGDARVSYTVMPTGGTVTVFGARVASGMLVPYFDQKKEVKLYDLLPVGSKGEAVAALHGEFTTLTWILRLVGFFMMFAGLLLILGPISVLLDVVPLFGTVSRSLIGLVAFVVTFFLSGITILVSKLFHSVLALLITIAAASIASFVIFASRKKQAPPPIEQAPPATPPAA